VADPYLIDQPFVVSFSGGRTNGFMLRNILDAHGGTLPENGKVIFCNTGKERPQTLDFVERCSQRWAVEVIWLEYAKAEPNKIRRVDYATASRNGEPFDQLITTKGMLPNVAHRYCTQWLKIKISNRYARHVLGWTPKRGGYTNCIGLRADEPRRVARVCPDKKSSPGEEPRTPMAQAGHTLADVDRFWSGQSFRLDLEPHEGNCDLCFLKGQGKLIRIMQDNPELAGWWIEKERIFQGKTRLFEAGRFRKAAPSYAATLERAGQPGLYDGCDIDIPDCRCTD
jgi:3'-phosphoadenosine 5'-phosphosulfate sulfotransferase (PAPS reductase)/FAD synthetase